MKLSDKIRYLREVEGSLRGLGRAMTQQEVVRAIAEEANPMSQSRDMGHPAPSNVEVKKGPMSQNRDMGHPDDSGYDSRDVGMGYPDKPMSQKRDMGHPERGKKSKTPSKAGATISQSYLSQIESGARPHLTNTTRLLLARFFKVHPGYLVDDPEGYHAELMSEVRTLEDKLDLWLIAGAERFRRDAELCQALLTLSRHSDSRRCLLLLESVLETPELVDRLFEVLRPGSSSGKDRSVGQKVPTVVAR